jgi:hypothetical protein
MAMAGGGGSGSFSESQTQGQGYGQGTSQSQGTSEATRGQAEKISAMGQYATSLLPQIYRQNRIANIGLPGYQDQMSQVSGGNLLDMPTINSGQVWDPAQIQAQVNAATSYNDAQLQNTMRQNAQHAAAQGYGSGSPLEMALNAQAQGQHQAANDEAARNIRWGAAQGNAQQLLAGQTARGQQEAARQQAANQIAQTAGQQRTSLYGSLTGTF